MKGKLKNSSNCDISEWVRYWHRNPCHFLAQQGTSIRPGPLKHLGRFLSNRSCPVCCPTLDVYDLLGCIGLECSVAAMLSEVFAKIQERLFLILIIREPLKYYLADFLGTPKIRQKSFQKIMHKGWGEPTLIAPLVSAKIRYFLYVGSKQTIFSPFNTVRPVIFWTF